MPKYNILEMATQSDKDNTGVVITVPVPKERFQARHVFAFMGFLGFINIYAMRVNLSVAIVAMVNSSFIPHEAQNSNNDTCPIDVRSSNLIQSEGEFPWNEATQGVILGSFFWGYVVTNPIGGRLGDTIGGKRVYCFGIFISSLLTLVTPLASRMSSQMLIAVRVCLGLAQGVTFPAMNSMMSKWIPPLKRSQTASMVFAGAQMGIVVAYPLSGLMCTSALLGGWPLAFYVFGVLGLVYCVVWMNVIYDSPSEHPRISAEEKLYLASCLKWDRNRHQSLPIPFKEILHSRPFWAILICNISEGWGYYFLLTELPTYMKNILHFDISTNGALSALPYLMMWLCGLISGFVADDLRKRNILSTTSTRRIFNSIGLYGSGVCVVLAGYSGCSTKTTLALLIAGVGVNGATYAGYLNSHLDIADNYAGVLMGITNGMATIPGFIAPTVVGRLISGQETLTQWRLVFWIAGIVYFVGNTFYVIFISGEEQPWNRIHSLNNSSGHAASEAESLITSQADEAEQNLYKES